MQTKPRRPRRYHICVDCRFIKQSANGKRIYIKKIFATAGIMQMLQPSFFSLMMSVRAFRLPEVLPNLPCVGEN